MQGTRSSFSSVCLSVIDMEVAEIATSFLTFLGTCSHNDHFACRYSTRRGLGP